MKIIIGLGNPGDRYAYTYHNLGFLAAECFADRYAVSFKKRECDAVIAKAFLGGDTAVIAKPATFMNLSGLAAKQLLKKYKAEISDLIVICDDIDIARGTIRVREKGSGGTHNGLKNIISELGSGDFWRVRIGIGKPENCADLADYVLSEIPKADRELFFETIGKAADEVEKIIKM